MARYPPSFTSLSPLWLISRYPRTAALMELRDFVKAGGSRITTSNCSSFLWSSGSSSKISAQRYLRRVPSLLISQPLSSGDPFSEGTDSEETDSEETDPVETDPDGTDSGAKPLSFAFSAACSMASSEASTLVTSAAPASAAFSPKEPVCVKQSRTLAPGQSRATARRFSFWSRKAPWCQRDRR